MKFLTLSVIGFAALLPAAGRTQTTATPYPTMAPIDQYRMTPAAEIALAKSAAPAGVSAAADILVLGAAGYETASKGTNGFVCLVERSWANDFVKADFWNPKNRGPICYNPAAARSVLPTYLTRTTWVLAGVSQAKMAERSPAPSAAPAPEVGAMAYMLSPGGYLGDDAKGPWHPHLMFFLPRTPAAAWGADLQHSPVVLLSAPNAGLTLFVVPVARWGDGSSDSTRRE